MRRCVIALLVLWGALVPAVSADPSDLAGVWCGAATLHGEQTPLCVQFERRNDRIEARLSLPDIGLPRLPAGLVTDNAQGAVAAGPLSLTRDGAALSGTLASFGGGIFISAMEGQGGPALVRLTRSARGLPELGVRMEEVSFRNGGITLAGTLVLPDHGRGPFPAIVEVTGSGPSYRWYGLGRAREWAQLGYATLIYDKRGTGASTGDWQEASLDDLADDVIAAFRLLRARSDIRASSIGLWTHSQGGWVGLRATARGANTAFMIAVSGGGAKPAAVERFGYASRLRQLGVDDAERTRANVLVERYFSYLAGDIDLAALHAAFDEARSAPWFNGLGIASVVPSEGERANWRWVATYDPASDIAGLHAPTLVVLAGKDQDSLLEDAVDGWTRALAAANAVDSRIVIYPPADHDIATGGAGWRRPISDYEATVANFLRRQAALNHRSSSTPR